MNGKKKFLILTISLLSAISTLFTLPASVLSVHAAEDTPDLKLYAQSAVLMDADSGRILYEKNGQKVMPMASTTKIMTCILALEYGNLEDYALVSSYAASMPKVKLGVSPNEYYKLKDLLYCLMLESHNDAAVVIAEHIAGSTEAFADMMNQKARDIGCYDTFFITPNGLDATAATKDGSVKAHSTTAADLARIMSYCITDSPRKEEFLTITRTPSYSLENYREKDGVMTSGGRNFHCNNHNAFLSMMEGALCGKTGFTGAAGYCYVGALRRDERTYVVALLACGWPNNKTYKWHDAKLLLNEARNSYYPSDIVEITHINKTVAVKNGTQNNISLRYDDAYSALISKNDTVNVVYNVPEYIEAPVSKNDEVGNISVYINDELFKSIPLYANEDVIRTDWLYYLKTLINPFLFIDK